MKIPAVFLKKLPLLTLALVAPLLALSVTTATEASPVAAVSTAPSAAPTPYPLTICVVSGDKLGVMGPVVVQQYQGEEVHFCCKECIKDFEKDPEKYMSRLHEAEAKQKAHNGS